MSRHVLHNLLALVVLVMALATTAGSETRPPVIRRRARPGSTPGWS